MGNSSQEKLNKIGRRRLVRDLTHHPAKDVLNPEKTKRPASIQKAPKEFTSTGR
jgi:hypothetical protein